MEKVKETFEKIIVLQSMVLLLEVFWGCSKYIIIVNSAITIVGAIWGIRELRKEK